MCKFTEIFQQRWLAVLLFGYKTWLMLVATRGVAIFKALALRSESVSSSSITFLTLITPH